MNRLKHGGVVDKISAVANIIPNFARALLGLSEERGVSPERLCRGLGFSYQDLLMHQVLLSYQQNRQLILRAQRMMQDPALGIAVGARQTPVSWGIAGLGMLTCETFGDALQYVLSRQVEAGALIDSVLESRGNEVMVDLVPRRLDLQIEGFLIDESMSGALAIARYLVGPEFRLLRIDMTQARPANESVYRNYFGCPIRFHAGVNRMVFEAHWLGVRLPGYDRITCSLLRAQLNTLLQQPAGRDDLVESIANQMRFSHENAVSQANVADAVNVSSRSLRRRLSMQGTSYRELRDDTRYQTARELLAQTQMSIAQIAERVGYSDARAFRRAFKRWSGILPGEFRELGGKPAAGR